MNPANLDLENLLKRLHLANARRTWRDLVRRAETEQWSFHDFLALLAGEEVAHRQQTRLARLSRRAQFPFLKTIDEFDFTYQSSLRLALLGSALAPDFVTEGRCLILQGKPGRGKTHCDNRQSIALERQRCQAAPHRNGMTRRHIGTPCEGRCSCLGYVCLLRRGAGLTTGDWPD
jgi:hypothetical protein